MDYSLKQHGRASFDFIRDLRLRAMPLQQDMNAYAAFLNLPTPDDVNDLDQRYDQIETLLNECQSFRTFKILTDWSLLTHGKTAFAAFDEISDEVTPELSKLDKGSTSLVLDPGLVPPDYWTSVDFHGTTGNWDGHDYMGFLHAELIHKELVAKTFPSLIFRDRGDVANLVARPDVKKVLELGCSSGPFTIALSEAMPEADIWACDISQRQLEQARRVAHEKGLTWHLFQAKAEETKCEADEFDMVASYAMFHELPLPAAREVLQEAYRILKPGGHLVMADVKSYAVMDDYEAFTADLWNHKRGYDPYWRDYATTDFAAFATELGFIEADWRGLGENQYPFLLTAQKPQG